VRACVGRVVDDSVLGSTARLERKIESAELELDSDRIGSERADGLIEQLLAGLVSFEDDDRAGFHAGSLVNGKS